MTANFPDSPAGSSGSGVGAGGSGSSGGTKEQVKEQARQAAGSAAEESRHVAGVASGEAARVASEAKSQVAGLVGQATSQVQEQSRTQLGRVTELVRSVADDLESMASGSGPGSGPAAGVVSEAAERLRGLSSSLEGREPGELVEDVRRFARRRPGVFLVGSLAAGVLAGRLTRGAKAAQSGSSQGGPDGSHRSAYGSTSGDSQSYLSHDAGSRIAPDGFDYASAGTSADPYAADPTLPNPATSVAGGTSYTGGTQAGRP
jgi:hypothetical protein